MYLYTNDVSAKCEKCFYLTAGGPSSPGAVANQILKKTYWNPMLNLRIKVLTITAYIRVVYINSNAYIKVAT